MATFTGCGHSKDYEPGKVYAGNCYTCRFTARLGQRISVGRFGDAVEYSFNHSAGCLESGMSCYEIRDGRFVDTVRAEFSDRPLWIGEATLVDSGGDDEPVVSDFIGRIATKSERQMLGV